MSFITAFGIPFVLWALGGVIFIVVALVIAETSFGRATPRQGYTATSSDSPSGEAGDPSAGGAR